jgi:hypothetical protein
LEVEQVQAKLSVAAIVQNQELKQLQTNVNLTDSELQVSKSSGNLISAQQSSLEKIKASKQKVRRKYL